MKSVFLNLLLFIPFQWWQVEKVNPIKLYEENKVIAGFSLLNLLFKQNRGGLIKGVMDKLLNLYNNKKIKPVVDSLWALEEVGAKISFPILIFLNIHIFRCKISSKKVIHTFLDFQVFYVTFLKILKKKIIIFFNLRKLFLFPKYMKLVTN